MLPLSVDQQSTAHNVQTRVVRFRQSCGSAHQAMDIEKSKSYPTIWRPWVQTASEVGKRKEKTFYSGSMASSNRQMTARSALGFQHPVRLCMPKSRTQEYLSHLGRKVLASFPVQATLHFYNDDSSSEEEDEEATEQWEALANQA